MRFFCLMLDDNIDFLICHLIIMKCSCLMLDDNIFQIFRVVLMRCSYLMLDNNLISYVNQLHNALVSSGDHPI
jgi:hypothetical protein